MTDHNLTPIDQIIVSWVANSFPRPLVKRSACIAIANMIGNTATIYGSYSELRVSQPFLPITLQAVLEWTD